MKTNLLIYTQLLFFAFSFFNQANGRAINETDTETTPVQSTGELLSSRIEDDDEEFNSTSTSTNNFTSAGLRLDLSSTTSVSRIEEDELSSDQFDQQELLAEAELAEHYEQMFDGTYPMMNRLTRRADNFPVDPFLSDMHDVGDDDFNDINPDLPEPEFSRFGPDFDNYTNTTINPDSRESNYSRSGPDFDTDMNPPINPDSSEPDFSRFGLDFNNFTNTTMNPDSPNFSRFGPDFNNDTNAAIDPDSPESDFSRLGPDFDDDRNTAINPDSPEPDFSEFQPRFGNETYGDKEIIKTIEIQSV